MKALGTTFKRGKLFSAELQTGLTSDDPKSMYVAIGRKRQKDAIADCNDVAKKLKWKVTGYTRK